MSWMRSAVALLAAAAGLGAASAAPDMLLIRGARVFDGTGAPARVEDVLVRGDRIEAVGPRLARPRGARLVDARGATLIPGLHDLHTHLRSPAVAAPDDLGKAYAGYLLDGITDVNDYSVSGEMLAPIRAVTGSGAVTAPHLSLAVRLGVPGGHGTEFGWGDFFTLEAATPRAAHVAMKRALAYRPDVIKVFADGWRYGRSPDLNSMNLATLAAIVADAHAAGLPVVTHTVTLEGAKVAAAAGVDALGHGVGDAPVDEELIALMKAQGTAYIPTMVVYEPQQDRRFLPGEWRAMSVRERAREEVRMAAAPAAIPPLEATRWAILRDNLKRLKAARIRIAVGTDAGIGGVYHGEAAIREIGWLAEAMTPREALAAATGVSASVMGDREGGLIAPGRRADMVLVAGRPDERIADLWNVRRVWLSGREVALARLRALRDGDAPTPLPAVRMTGPIDTGARGDGRTDLDTLPVGGSEGGADHSDLHLARPGEDRRLFATARLGAAARPFAQLTLPLTRGAVLPGDASGFSGVVFGVSGAGNYVLVLDSYGVDGGSWFRASFEALPDGAEVRLPFASFRSRDPAARLDPARLRALMFRLGGEPGGRAWLELKDVRFYR